MSHSQLLGESQTSEQPISKDLPKPAAQVRGRRLWASTHTAMCHCSTTVGNCFPQKPGPRSAPGVSCPGPAQLPTPPRQQPRAPACPPLLLPWAGDSGSCGAAGTPLAPSRRGPSGRTPLKRGEARGTRTPPLRVRAPAASGLPGPRRRRPPGAGLPRRARRSRAAGSST